MSVLSCRNGWFIIVVITMTILCAGCGVTKLHGSDRESQIPPSNRQVAETVLEYALNDLDIPPGGGKEVRCTVEGTGEPAEMAQVMAPEFLLNRGFRLSSRSETEAEIQISVDTLYIHLSVGKSAQGGKRVSRSAEARVSAVFFESDGTRKVFNGRGILPDSFGVSMLKTVGNDESYVIQSNHIVSILKPVVFGCAITTLAWILYSYRG
ncbi:hypothetical protein LLG96_15415 [bacterium]|nr:hypothetical protein [bacterium]